MLCDIYVFNIQYNSWNYTHGYVNALRKMGWLGKSGDLKAWHDPASLQSLFDGPSDCVLMIAPEHHRAEIFGTPAKRDAIVRLKRQTGKKLVAIIFESLVDPFGARAWAKAGNPWILDNYWRHPHKAALWQTTTDLAEQFQCFDCVFAHDEVDAAWLKGNGVNAYWIPTCADADVFKPMVEKPQNKAAFIGMLYWPRGDLIAAYPFKFDLVTVPRAAFDDPRCQGTTAELVKAFSSYLIGVNMKSPFGGITVRTFELMACGALPIVTLPAPDRVCSRALLSSWDNVFTFDEWSLDDRRKIQSYYCHMIANYDQSRQRGLENSKIIQAGHTPAHRIKEMAAHL
jgi:hypothetical protein